MPPSQRPRTTRLARRAGFFGSLGANRSSLSAGSDANSEPTGEDGGDQLREEATDQGEDQLRQAQHDHTGRDYDRDQDEKPVRPDCYRNEVESFEVGRHRMSVMTHQDDVTGQRH